MVLSALFSVFALETAALPIEPDRLSVLMQQACRIQQVDRQGGAEPDYFAFCQCLDSELAGNLDATGYRAFALGSQGAIQGRGEIADWEAARAESQRLFATLDPETRNGAGQVINDALNACVN